MMWDTRSIVYISFEAITGFITVVGNAIVLIAIVKTRRLHTVTNVFIGNLATADIFVGVFVAPLAGLSFLGLPADVYGCIFINSAILLFTNVSILMLLGVAVERFIAIRLPFAYNRLLTIRRALWFNAFIWVLGTVLGLIPMYGWNVAPDSLSACAFQGVISMEYMIYFQFFGLVVLPLIIMLIIYTYIFGVIRKHTKRTDALHNMFHRDRRSRAQWKKDVRAAKSFALLILLFAVFWLPVNIMNALILFCPWCYQPLDLLLVAIVMSHANSSINPFMYAASNSRIQKSVMALICRRHSREETSIDMHSGKDPPISRGGTSRRGGISVIADNTFGNPSNNARFGSPSSLLPKGNDSPSPELNQLLPTLLAIDKEASKEELAPADSTKVLVKSPASQCETYDTEAMSLANGSVNQLPHDESRFSDGQISVSDDKTEIFSKYSFDYITGLNQGMSYKQDAGVSPAKTSEHVSGQVNFAFIDDTSIISNDSSTLFSSSRKYTTKNDHKDNKSGAEDKSKDIDNYKENLQLEENWKKIPKEDSKKRVLVSHNSNPKVGCLKGTRKSVGFIDTAAFRKEFRQHSPIKGKDIFEMVDEPEDYQECSQIVFVVGDARNKGFSHTSEGEQGKTNAMNSVKHSYFQTPPKTKRKTNITDVEINSNELFINSETQQTQL